MALADALLSVVPLIYEAPLTAGAWRPALQSITELLGGEHAVLLASDNARVEGALAVGIGMDDSSFARFGSPEAAQWILPVMQTMRRGAAVTRSRVVPDRQFERTDFYNELVRPVGGFHAVAVVHQVAASSSFVTICRHRHAGDFDADEVAVMQALSPHLAAALTVRQRLGVADLALAGISTVLERMSTGVIVADAAARVVFANRIAERLFHERGLRLDRGELCARNAAATGKLRRMIAACANAGSAIEQDGLIEVPRTERNGELRIIVTPFHPERIGCHPGRPLALLLMSDPRREQQDRAAELQRRFGLTPAEAGFALEIVKGDGRAAAAARSNITTGTARTHLARIFEKTGVRRQAELVRLLLLDE